MNSVLRISEAAAIALHTMAHLAADPDRAFTNREIAAALLASEAHLSKVLQRLHRAGFLRSVRGPGGGYCLDVRPTDVTLLQVYECIDGKLETQACLLTVPVCAGHTCLLGGFLRTINAAFKKYLSETRLSDVVPHQERGEEHARLQENCQDR